MAVPLKVKEVVVEVIEAQEPAGNFSISEAVARTEIFLLSV
jgi:hypothetical protein